MATVRTNSIRVGAFVVVGVVLTIAALIYFGASDLLKPSQTYVTYFDTSVQGLNLDSSVKYRGVNVGSVANMKIAPDGILIEVTMDLNPDFEVGDSLGVQMNITGITGQRYLELDIASAEGLDTFPELSFEPPHPVIPSVPGGFEEIQTALKSAYEKLMQFDTEGISYEAKEFLRTGTHMMSHADSIVTAPNTTEWIDDLNSAMANLEIMVAQLQEQRLHSRMDSMLTSLTAAARNAEQGSVHLNSALATLDGDVQQLDIGARADTVFANINATFDQTAQLMGQSQYSVSQVVARLNITVAQLNETLEHMNGLILSLEEYPSRILYSAPPEREK